MMESQSRSLLEFPWGDYQISNGVLHLDQKYRAGLGESWELVILEWGLASGHLSGQKRYFDLKDEERKILLRL